MASTQAEKSGVHLTGVDSGWPVGAESSPGYAKAGTGVDGLPHASAVAAGVIADTGVDEVQTITITGSPAGGTITVKLGGSGDPSDTIAFNASATAVRTALEGSDDIAPGDVSVTGANGGPWTITFGGTLADKNVAALQMGTNGLTGGTSPSATFATLTPGTPR